MRFRAPAAVPLLLLTACLDPLPPPEGRLGLIVAYTYESGPDFVIAPVATFYNHTAAIYAPPATEACVVGGISNQFIGNPETMDAGDQITLTVSGNGDALTPVASGPFRQYELDLAPGLVLVPGDTLEFGIPGRASGFPASVIRVRTAEAFDHDVIPVAPEPDVDIDLTWDAPSEPGSIISFSLRYANSASNGLLNEQVLCVFDDDGAATIASSFLTGWRSAQDDIRATIVTRLRYSEVIIDDRTRVVAQSIFTRPLLAPP